MSQEIRVVSAALMPCDCMPGPYQCNVSTESQLPVCDRNGVVFTITNEPGFTQPYQVFCWDGSWYRMMDAARVWGLFRQDVSQSFPINSGNQWSDSQSFDNIYSVSDNYGIRTNGTVLTIPKAGVYAIQFVGSVDTNLEDGSFYTNGLSVFRNGVTGFPRERDFFLQHTTFPSPARHEVNFTEFFNIGDTLTFRGGISDDVGSPNYTAYLRGAYISVREL